MMGGAPIDPVDPGAPITDDQYNELVQLLQKVKDKSANITSNSFMIKNRAVQAKRDALKDIFSKLAAEGVDLTDPGSVGQFVAKLREQNPDLYELFVDSLDQLMNEESYDGTTDEEPIEPELPGVPEDLREPPPAAV